MLKFEVGTELVIGGLYTNDYLVRVVAREENRVQVQEAEYPDSDPYWHEIDVDAELDAERFLNWEYRGIKSYVYPDSTPEKVYGGEADTAQGQNRYFYTFGSDSGFPYQNGWVEVHADSWEEADQKFRARFPDRHIGILNCAFSYSAERWAEMDPEHTWNGWKCFEVIE